MRRPTDKSAASIGVSDIGGGPSEPGDEDASDAGRRNGDGVHQPRERNTRRRNTRRERRENAAVYDPRASGGLRAGSRTREIYVSNMCIL